MAGSRGDGLVRFDVILKPYTTVFILLANRKLSQGILDVLFVVMWQLKCTLLRGWNSSPVFHLCEILSV